MDDTQPQGYLVTSGTDAGPGVLVLHAWWGLTDMVKAVCDRLAAQGFTAYAPDLYHGKVAQTIAEAEALSEQLEPEAVQAEVQAAAERLWARTRNRQPGLGVIGFSLGAFYAVRLSTADPAHVRAVALFYGTGDGDFSQSQAAYLGHFAENDPYEEAEWVAWLENALQEAGRPVTFYHYPEVGHWFFESDRPEAYDEPAAQLAWARTLKFLRKELRLGEA